MSAIAFISVDSDVCEIADMPETPPRSLLDALMAVKPPELSPNAWAIKAGVSRTIFNDIRRRNNARHDSLTKLLDAIGVSLAEFEAGQAVVRTEVRGTGMTPGEARDAWALVGSAPPVPLLGTAFAGDWDGLEDVEMTELRLAEVLDYIARPPSLAEDPDAYAVEIVGDSMAPRFEPGERAFVSPRAPVRSGDDIIVQLREPHTDGSDLSGEITEVLIKRLVRRSATFLELRQFNPDRTFRVPMGRVRRIHRVRGRL